MNKLVLEELFFLPVRHPSNSVTDYINCMIIIIIMMCRDRAVQYLSLLFSNTQVALLVKVLLLGSTSTDRLSFEEYLK